MAGLCLFRSQANFGALFQWFYRLSRRTELALGRMFALDEDRCIELLAQPAPFGFGGRVAFAR